MLLMTLVVIRFKEEKTRRNCEVEEFFLTERSWGRTISIFFSFFFFLVTFISSYTIFVLQCQQYLRIRYEVDFKLKMHKMHLE